MSRIRECRWSPQMPRRSLLSVLVMGLLAGCEGSAFNPTEEQIRAHKAQQACLHDPKCRESLEARPDETADADTLAIHTIMNWYF